MKRKRSEIAIINGMFNLPGIKIIDKESNDRMLMRECYRFTKEFFWDDTEETN